MTTYNRRFTNFIKKYNFIGSIEFSLDKKRFIFNLDNNSQEYEYLIANNNKPYFLIARNIFDLDLCYMYLCSKYPDLKKDITFLISRELKSEMIKRVSKLI